MPPKAGHPRWGGRHSKDHIPEEERRKKKGLKDEDGNIINAATIPALRFTNASRPPSRLDTEIALKVAAMNLPSKSAEMRILIAEKYDPVMFLGEVMTKGWIRTVGPDGEEKIIEFDPDLQVTAARVLTNKVVPDLRLVEQQLAPPKEIQDYYQMSDTELLTLIHRAKSVLDENIEKFKDGRIKRIEVGGEVNGGVEVGKTGASGKTEI